MARFVMFADPLADQTQIQNLFTTIDDTAGEIVLGLGSIGAIVDGDQGTIDGLNLMIGDGVLAVFDDPTIGLPGGLPAEITALFDIWAGMVDPALVAVKEDPDRPDVSFDDLGGCGLGVS